jgi:hypothetical protein
MSKSRIRYTFLIAVLALSCGIAFSQQNIPARPATSEANGAPTLDEEQIRELIRRAAERDIENDKQQRNYTYIERDEEHRLSGDGKVKSRESRTVEIMDLYGHRVRRVIAKDDKPLSDKDAAREEEKIQRVIDMGKNESDEDRRKRLEKEDKEREEGRAFVKEIADAYNFRLVDTQIVDGHSTHVIDADPRPGFEPHQKNAKFLPKFRFRVWIDEKDEEWIKLDIQCIDTVSVGLFLASIHKGSNIQIEQTEVNNEIWLPKHVALRLDARVLFSGENLESDVTYRDYKKFRTNTKIVPVGEAQPSH